MPLLPLPEGETDLSGGDLPVVEESDTLVVFPRPIKAPESAPVRDTFVSGWTQGFITYQNIAAYAAAQSDPMRATGEYLLSFADERSIVRVPGESEESVRSRLFKAPEIVTPQAIVDGVNEILADVTDDTCRLIEPNLDGWFVQVGAGNAYNCYVGAAPDAIDRYWDVDPAFAPRACYPSSGRPRSFVLQIPQFNTTEQNFAFIPATNSSSGPFALSTNLSGGMYVYQDPQTASAVYSKIVAFVERVKGQGISWALVTV